MEKKVGGSSPLCAPRHVGWYGISMFLGVGVGSEKLSEWVSCLHVISSLNCTICCMHDLISSNLELITPLSFQPLPIPPPGRGTPSSEERQISCERRRGTRKFIKHGLRELWFPFFSFLENSHPTSISLPPQQLSVKSQTPEDRVRVKLS